MTKRFSIWLASVLAVASCQQAIAATYYIDNQTDFNANKTRTYGPGDQILFKKGAVFSGMFAPKGSGSAGNPIIIDSYGSGPMPIINALGKNKAAIQLKNIEYWEVHNMEVTNTDGSNSFQGEINGIHVLSDDDRPHEVMNHIYIKNCYVHHTNGTAKDGHTGGGGARRYGGIHVQIYSTPQTRMNDVRIVGNTVKVIGGTGIGMYSVFNAVQDNDISMLWTGTYVGHNYIDDTDRNNMIVRESISPLVEYNTLANSSRANTGHSLFNFQTIDFVAQYNEAYGNTGDDGKDRGGFDADYNAKNTTYQYNYSHDNMWFCGIMKKFNEGVTIRYNISQNDRDGFCFYGFDSAKDCKDVVFHNNVYYLGPQYPAAQFVAENRRPWNTDFFNNVFYYGNEGSYGTRVDTASVSFSHNAYYGIPVQSKDNNAVTGDPKLVDIGSGGTRIDMTDPNRLSGYRLQPGSPCIDAGKAIAGVTQDFWGNPVPYGGGTDIGVHEYQPPVSTIAPTYGNGGIPGTGNPWLITRSATTRIEAENYDQGEANVVYSDTTEGNEGGQYRTNNVDISATSDGGAGYNVGWTKAGEWLQYSTDVENTGLYDLTIRYSRAALETSGLKVSMNGLFLSGTINAPGTGDWGTYTSLTTRVELQGGEQVMRLHFLDGSININWLDITPVATPVITMDILGSMESWDVGATWSDGNPAHGQADYIVPATGNLISPTVTASFPGYSLTVEPGGKFQVRSYETDSEIITVGDLIFDGGTGYTPGNFTELSAGSGSYQTNVLGGTILNSGYMRILSFENVGGNPYHRGMKLLSKIEGTGHIQAWEGQGGQGGDNVIIDNESNTFAGTWETGTGSTLIFVNAGSVGAADIEVLDEGKLRIVDNWQSDGALTVADTATAQVDLGAYVWSVSNVVFGGSAIADGVYSASELNAMGSNPVFTGAGTLRVGTGDLSNPLAYWPMDDGSGTVATDASGNGHDGTLENDVVWGSDATRSSYVSFDGINDRISTDVMIDITAVDKDFTCAYWVNNQMVATNSTQKNAVIVGNRYPALGEDLHFMKHTPTKQEVRVAGTDQGIDYEDLSVGQWHHCAVVKSGSTLTYYRDGAEVASRALTTYAPAALPFFIGGDPNTGSANEHFNGFIDDVVLYGSALPSDQVVSIMNGEFGSNSPESPTLDAQIVGGDLSFSWSGAVFQMQICTNLTEGAWEDYPNGDEAPVNVLPTNPAAYFRLIEQ